MDIPERIQQRASKSTSRLEHLSFEEGLRELGPPQPAEEEAQEDPMNVQKHLKGGFKEVRDRLFVVSSVAMGTDGNTSGAI